MSFAVLALTLIVSSCGRPGAPVVAVSPLPVPKVPALIEQISPTGQANNLAQIRVRFKRPLIPLEAIESPDQQAKLALFSTTPALAGHFRFLTPRMVGFQADQAPPKATRVQVVVHAGLSDIENNRLAADVAWTFTTEPIVLSNLPQITDYSSPVGPRQTFNISANTELDIRSMQRHTVFSAKGQPDVSAAIKLEPRPTPPPCCGAEYAAFDPNARGWKYDVTPQRPLAGDTTYSLYFGIGIMPAHGNLPTTEQVSGDFEVYGPFAFRKIGTSSDSLDRFTKPPATLDFNNPVASDSIAKNITVSPATKPGVDPFTGGDGSKRVFFNEDAFAPATTYTITILPGLKDAFDQTLGSVRTVTYRTGDLVPSVWAPAGFFVFPAADRLQLDFYAVNLPHKGFQQFFKVLKPADLVYMDPTGDLSSAFKGGGVSATAAGALNEAAHVGVPLRQRLGGNTGLLAYAVTAYVGGDDPNHTTKTISGAVQLTNLGVFAQWFPQSGIVRVHHLSDGSPAAGAAVEIWPSRTDWGPFVQTPVLAPCTTGHTDASGTAAFDVAALFGCLKNVSAWTEPPSLVTVVREGADWAFTRTQQYSGAYDYDIGTYWNLDAPESRGVIFSDRQLYQPGETGWFTGEAYYLDHGTLKRGAGAHYKLTLEDPNGAVSAVGSADADAYGVFSVQLHLKRNQPLGYYTLHASGANGVKIDGTFRVAEFKPPNFKVELKLDKDVAVARQTVGATSTSTYLFGAPVQNGRFKFYVTREPSYFTPKGWDEYRFGRIWEWPEEPPSVPSDVAQTTGSVGADGVSKQTISVANDLPYAMTYRADFETTDPSNLSVADSQSFSALPSDTLIGLNNDFVEQAGNALPVQVIVTDPAGAPKEGVHVHLSLQSVNYSAVTQLVEGSTNERWQVEYKTVAETDVTSARSPQTASLTPKVAGFYRIRANVAGAIDDRTATDSEACIAGNDIVTWGNKNPDQLTIKLDKKSYRAGDTATALVESPYPAGDLYLAVVRYTTLYRKVVHVTGSAPKVSFTVTPDMLPNAAVEAVMVRQGTPLSKGVPTDLDSLSRVGFVPLSGDMSSQRLTVNIAAAKAKLEPGQGQTLTLHMKDASGKPARGEFSVLVVNEAILQLSGYRPPDLLDTVFAEQSIPTRFSDNRPNVVLRPFASPLEKGWGYGGGPSEAAAGTRIRTNFRPLAFYKAALVTDANGSGSVTFALPDDLTTWHVLAVAVSGTGPSTAWRFGGGDTTFIATKALVTNPILPQFARPGDHFQAGVAITNTEARGGDYSIEGMLSGPLAFENPARAGQTTQVTSLSAGAQPGTQAFRFPMVASGLGATRVRFVTKLGSLSDAFEVPFELRTLPITEQAVETGATETSATIPLKVDPKADASVGGLDVEMASILLPEFSARAKAVLDEDEDLPFLEPIASQLLITANLQILATRYGQIYPDFHPADAAANDLNRLALMQLADGGFASWPGSKQSDPWVSPYAAEALARAQSAGLAVDQPMIARLRAYLERNLADPSRFSWCITGVCRAELRLRSLMGLAELGEVRNDYLSDIYQFRDDFDPVTRIKLARYLTRFPDWSKHADALATEIEQNTYETGRNASLTLPNEWSWLSSPTIAQSEALRLFVVRRASAELLDRLARVVIAQRVQGTWPEYYDNAAALTALVDYSRTQPTNAEFTATLTVAGKVYASEHFAGYKNALREAHVSMAQLPVGASDIMLAKSGTGQLHYVTVYRYRLLGELPGALNGLRVTRDIRLANDSKVLRSFGLSIPSDPLALGAARVYDIGLEVIADHPVEHLVITDPLPAGLEAVDTTFKTATQYYQTRSDNWEIDYQNIYRDRVVAYANHLEPGVYDFHYLVRSVTPGTFEWPGAEVHLQYAPEEFGRTASSQLVIR